MSRGSHNTFASLLHAVRDKEIVFVNVIRWILVRWQVESFGCNGHAEVIHMTEHHHALVGAYHLHLLPVCIPFEYTSIMDETITSLLMTCPKA